MKTRHDKNPLVIAMVFSLLSFTSIPAISMAADPWEPRGLESVWSHGHSSHPDFMNVRRQQYESQIDASSSSAPKVGAIVNLYEQGRSVQSREDIVVSKY